MILSDIIGETASIPPLNLPFDILDFFELVAYLHDGETNHSGIETKRSPDSSLHWTRRVEAHDEVLAIRIPGLVLRGRSGQSEGTPVGVAADYAARPEDLNTGITGDSGVC